MARFIVVDNVDETTFDVYDTEHDDIVECGVSLEQAEEIASRFNNIDLD